MILGIVSDTHLPRFGRELPKRLVAGLKKAGVQCILHAGDLTEQIALELFGEIAPVIAVAGNNDGKKLHKELGQRRIVTLAERRIGLVHGHAGRGRTTLDRAWNAFAGEPLDAIVFGHSHIPWKTKREGVVLFNPGSPTDKRMNPAYSYGIATIDETGVHFRHRFYLMK